MTEPTFGVVFNRTDDDPRPAIGSDLSVVGIVLPSEDAVATAFPLNEPVHFNSSDPLMIANLGTGDLAKAVALIDAQLGDFQSAARVVAVRVSKGANDAATIANIIGSESATTAAGNVGTGLHALKRAGVQLGVIPRILCAPGYTHQTTVGSPVITKAAKAGNVGTGTMGAVTALSGLMAGVYRVVIKSTATNGGAFDVFSPAGVDIGDGTVGVAFATQIGFTLADGVTDFAVGDEFTVTVTGVVEANPVVAALPAICSALLAHAVVSGPGGDLAETVNWRETINSPRLIPNADWVKVSNGVTTEFVDGAAAAVGAMVRTDFSHRGFPFWTAANQAVYGIVGLKRYRPFSLTDGATEGQEVLSTRTAVFQRGQIGVETAAVDSGFVWDGVHNADVDPLWWFYNKSRGRDWAHLALLKSIRLRLGRQNISARSVEQVLEDAIVVGREMVQNGGSLGLKVAFDGETNSVENLRMGKFRISFANEEPPPVMQVGVDSKPYRKAMEITLANIIAQSQAMLPIYAA